MSSKIVIQMTADLPLLHKCSGQFGHPTASCGTLLDAVTQRLDTFDLYAIDDINSQDDIASNAL